MGTLALAVRAVLVLDLFLVVLTEELNKIAKSLPACYGGKLPCLRDHHFGVLFLSLPWLFFSPLFSL